MAQPRTPPRSGAVPFTPVDRAYKDRVRRILNDETYGPKLVKLNKTDQQTVLQHIYRKDGKGARQAILDLDAARRGKATMAGRARRYAALPPDQRSARWRDVRDRVHEDGDDARFWDLYKNILRG